MKSFDELDYSQGEIDEDVELLMKRARLNNDFDEENVRKREF
jgi:hypothetical protein